MVTLSDLRAAERSMRDLLEGEGLPQPDEVEYEESSVVLRWREAKAVVVIDVTERCLEPLRDDAQRRPASPPHGPART